MGDSSFEVAWLVNVRQRAILRGEKLRGRHVGMTLDLMGRAKRMSNEALMRELASSSATEHSMMVNVIVLLSEVDARRSWAQKAVPSLFEYCVRKLGYSEGQAFRRIRAARSIQKWPSLLRMLERREIHLTNIAMIFDHLAHPKYERLANEVGMNRKSEVPRILARWFPKPDIRPSVRRIEKSEPPASLEPMPMPMPMPAEKHEPPASHEAMPLPMPGEKHEPPASHESMPMPMPMPMAGASSPQPPQPLAPAKVEPRSAERYAVKFMTDEDGYRDLTRAKELCPGTDLNELMKRALRLLREDAEKVARAKTARPKVNPRQPVQAKRP